MTRAASHGKTGQKAMRLRPMNDKDRAEVAELIYVSINVWYQKHGRPRLFVGGPQVTEVYYDVYNALTPGCSVVAENPRTGRIMGSCFYHPRRHHVSLGIMNVHPNYFGQGVARALLGHIVDFTDQRGYKSLRLTSSAVNLDSFSLYNRAGFVPRAVFQDMLVAVPDSGLSPSVPNADKVRDAVPADVPAMADLEREVSGITREEDYAYCIANQLGFWHVAVFESGPGNIDGFMISTSHAGVNMLGPSVARTEEVAAALLFRELDLHRGRSPIFLVPADRPKLVQQVYAWGGRNTEVHLCQVRGEFQPFRGISMPTFLPETG
jgi:GNAT superfamily N-acetyltransferase